MKNEAKKKVKDAWEKYSGPVGCGIAVVGLIGLGYVTGSVVTEWKTAIGLKCLHESGIMRFFNESGAEIGIEEVTEKIKRRLL